MSVSRDKTAVSFSFSFGQEDYLYDIEKMRAVLSSRLRALFELKSLNVVEFRYAQLGATGGTGGVLSLLVELYHNHALIFALGAKLPALVKITKGSIKLFSNLRQDVATRQWTRYQKKHDYDHYIDVYLHTWVMSHGTSPVLIKRSVQQALNQMMLLFPEIIKEVETVYPDYVVRLNLVVLSRQGSDYVIDLHNNFTRDDHREKVLRLVDKQPDANYPIRVTVDRGRFGRKLTVIPRLELLKYFHNLVEAK